MMMTRNAVLAIAAAGMMVGTAAAQAPMRAKPNPWLDCGIGALIFPDDNVEAAAGISNVIFDLGTTAVTSAASSPDTCNGLSNVQMAIFIERTYDTLEIELAQGHGDNLVELSRLVEAEDQQAFVTALRSEVAVRFAAGEFDTADRSMKVQTLYNLAVDVANLG